MELIKTKLDGVYIVEPQVFGDERGWFMETYSKIKTPEINCDFVQDNQSYSKEKGILRGIHFQNGEHGGAQGERLRARRPSGRRGGQGGRSLLLRRGRNQ